MSNEKQEKSKPEPTQVMGQVTSPLPRVTIQFCTQCKWMLRAAYYAQELLSTFNLSLGEVALQPSTGGTFIVTVTTANASTSSRGEVHATSTISTNLLWDRKTDGGFPETKELKRRLRDVIEPGRDLGHVDRDHRREGAEGVNKDEKMVSGSGDGAGSGKVDGKEAECEDCK